MNDTKPYRLIDGRMLEVEEGDRIILLDILEIVQVDIRNGEMGEFTSITGKHGLDATFRVDADFYPWLKNLLLNRELLGDNNSFARDSFYFTPDFSDD